MREKKQRPIPPLEYDKKPFSQRIREKKYQDYDFYTVREMKGNKLKSRTVAVYRGDYYRADVSDARLRGQKALYWVLYLAAAILYLMCSIQDVPSNVPSYVGIVQSLALCVLLYLAFVLIIYCTAERDMTAQTYRTTSRRLAQLGTAAAVLLGLCAVLTAVAGLVTDSFSQSSPLMIGFVVSGVVLWSLNWLENALPYDVQKSTDQPPEGADRWEAGKK